MVRCNKRASPAPSRPNAEPQHRAKYPCTYDLGYVRQDVYSCTKCSTKDTPAGFCVACKDVCHGDHADAVIDLYSKRAFRCDCGNSRMACSCLLASHKPASNPDNERVYSHNFAGLYCRCNRGYDALLGDMMQCAMCEDWFHSTCISVAGLSKASLKVAIQGENTEFTCRDCVVRLPVLLCYFGVSGMFVPKTARVRDMSPEEALVARPGADCAVPLVAVENIPENEDLFWCPGFLKNMCVCVNCRAMYFAAGFGYLVEEREMLNAAVGRNDDSLLMDGTEDKQILKDVLAETEIERRESNKREKDENESKGEERISNGIESAEDGDSFDAVANQQVNKRPRRGKSIGTGLRSRNSMSRRVADRASRRQRRRNEADECDEDSDKDTKEPLPNGTGRAASNARDDSEDSESFERSAEVEQHQRVQAKIRDFLQQRVGCNGPNVTPAAICSYLADLKGELRKSVGRKRRRRL